MKSSPIPIEDSKFLIIDDNKMNVNVVEATLASGGYRNFTSVVNALDIADLIRDQEFDLVLLDINMPIMDGFSVLALFQQHWGVADRPPVIMVTAQTDEESRIRALEVGASDYLTKPFNRIELLKRVAIHLQNWHMKRALQSENIVLTSEVQARTKALEEAKMEMIYRLGRAAEYRDNETGNHVKRVSLIAQAMAEELGMDTDYCELISIASPMHDIGKIGVSDTILLKPGKLNDDEYLLMQEHVKIGAEILSNSDSDLLKMAHEIALTHHEKYNGKGYPHGLKAKQIPLSGRIVAVADVFDALTSERPYKRAWSTEQAVALIEREKGEHFDPVLVEAFLKILPKVQLICDRYQESSFA